MSDFEDFWSENYGEHSGQSKGSYAKMYVAFEAGKEARQSEINDLTFKLNGAQFTLNCMARNVQEYKVEIDGLKKQLITQGQHFNNQSQKVADLEHKNSELKGTIKGIQMFLSDHREDGLIEKAFHDDISQIIEDGEYVEKALQGES